MNVRNILGRYGKKRIKLKCFNHVEKTPSLVLDLKKMKYHCFGCGIDGKFKFTNNGSEIRFDQGVANKRQSWF